MNRRELEAWEPQEPPVGFAERVVEQARRAAAPPPRHRRRLLGAAAVVLPLVAAAAVWLLWLRAPREGALTAAERSAVEVGRAAMVLETGAEVRWRDDVVTQLAGDVFYRVAPGDTFRVVTPAGELTVLGTCFRVKVRGGQAQEASVKKRDALAGAVGVAVGAVVVVGVYEGKVRASQAGSHVDVAAGEAARLDEHGVRRAGEASALEAALDAPASADPAFAEANKNLSESVRDLNRRLATLDQQKQQLERQLATAQEELSKAVAEGKARPARHEFDLTPEDWEELSKDGSIKYRMPCIGDKGFRPGADDLDKLGLPPDDADDIAAVYKQSNQRLWDSIRPICVKMLGNADVVDKLGADTCTHLIVNVSSKQDKEGTQAARKLVGEIRAGKKPMPGPGEQLHPVAQLFLALTGEMPAFERDLAEAFGPEEAHRLAYSNKGLCFAHSTFGGSPPKGLE